MPVPIPDNDRLRVQALHRLEVLDTEPEPCFDEITSLVKHIYGAPIAAVSLLDAQRVWLKSCLGADIHETSREVAFCSYAILTPEVLIVPDTLEDPIFKNHPLVVQAPFIRSYIGAPLVTQEGLAVGVLCVVDFSPRTPESIDVKPIRDLASTVVHLLELRRNNRLRLQQQVESSETSLRRAEHRLRDALKFSGVATWNWDIGKDSVLWAGPVEKLFGRPTTELNSLETFLRIVLPEDRASLMRLLEISLSSGGDYEAEFRTTLPDGTARWVAARGGVSQTINGKAFSMSGVNFDIHDYKQATDELARMNRDLDVLVQERSAELVRSERRHRLMVEGVKDYSIFMLDPTGRVNTWNAGAERIKQYTASEIIGQHFSVFYPSELIATGHPQFELESAAREGQYAEEGWRVRKDGSRFWANVLITSIHDDEGRLYGFSKVVRDLTAQRNAEERILAEQQRAEEANRAKSNFLATMSHEIRTPMNAILGMADLLWETELQPVQRQYVEIFRRAGANLLTLVNDILDLSKIEAGQFDLETIEFDLRELVTRTVQMVTPKVSAKHLQFNHTVDDNIRTFVGDPVRVQQVLMNLLGNAVKFTEQGRIGLAVGTLENGQVFFEISDTGIGIPANMIDRIFDDFTQGESSTTRRFGGTGLGLGICRRLVEKMNGKLTVESQYGKGSKFRFTLSLQACSSDCAAPPESVADFVGRRILILDANDTARMILANLCSGWGMDAYDCSDPVEALDVLFDSSEASKEFDVLIADSHLCGEKLGFVQRVRSRFPKISVIVTSEESNPGEVTRATELGVVGFALKPIRRADLMRMMCGALTSQAADSNPENLPGASQHPVRVLIAEDSEDNRYLLEAYLKGSVYQLQFVDNGAAAVEVIKNFQFHLVLMDVQMPVMDGLTATALIRQHEKENSAQPVPIVALTANARQEDIAECKGVGCTAHLSKPIAKSTLLATMQKYAATPTESEAIDVDIPEGMEELAVRYVNARLNEWRHGHQLLQSSEFSQIARLAHNMKGTGLSYGFPPLTKIGATIEDAAKQQDRVEIGNQLLSLMSYLEKAVAVVNG